MISLEKHLQSVIHAHEVISEPYLIKYFGEKYIIFPKVFSPVLTASTTTIMRSMIKRKRLFRGKVVLDMGCGCGVLGIQALRLGADAGHAVDISSIAVNNTMENTERLGLVNRLKVSESNLFSQIKENEVFDIVLANLPFADKEAKDEWEMAFFDYKYQIMKDFLSNLYRWMNPGGHLFLNSASIANVPQVVNWAIDGGLSLKEVDLFENYVFIHYVLIFYKP